MLFFTISQDPISSMLRVRPGLREALLRLKLTSPRPLAHFIHNDHVTYFYTPPTITLNICESISFSVQLQYSTLNYRSHRRYEAAGNKKSEYVIQWEIGLGCDMQWVHSRNLLLRASILKTVLTGGPAHAL